MKHERNFSSLATLRNLASDLEKEMRHKHVLMQETKNSFLSLQRQYKDLQFIIAQLEKDGLNLEE